MRLDNRRQDMAARDRHFGDREYELKKIGVSDSTIEARSLLLFLIPKLVPEMVSDLFRTGSRDDPLVSGAPADKKPGAKRVDRRDGRDDDRPTPIRYLISELSANESQFKRLIELEKKEFLKPDGFEDFRKLLGLRRTVEVPDFPAPPERFGLNPIEQNALRRLLRTRSFPKKGTPERKKNNALLQWCKDWNFMEAWCFDFAADAIVAFYSQILNHLRLRTITDQDLEDVKLDTASAGWVPPSPWLAAKIRLENSAIVIWPEKDVDIPDLPNFEFTFKRGKRSAFTVEDRFIPLHEEASDFRARVEERFWNEFRDYTSSPHNFIEKMELVSLNLNAFKFTIGEYISQSRKTYKEKLPPAKKKVNPNRDFSWFVTFQFGKKDVEDIAEQTTFKFEKNKTKLERLDVIRKAIRKVAKLVSMDPRPSPRKGRPKGSKTTKFYRAKK